MGGFFIITLNNRDFKHLLYQFASEFCFAFLKRLIFYFKSLRFKTFSYLLIHHCSSSRSNKSNENHNGIKRKQNDGQNPHKFIMRF